jgi:Polysaccharide lyase
MPPRGPPIGQEAAENDLGGFMPRRRRTVSSWLSRIPGMRTAPIAFFLIALLAVTLSGSGGAASGVISQLTFENGTFSGRDYSEGGPWWAVTCNPQRPITDCATPVTTSPRSGSKAMQMTLRQGDSAFGWNEQAEFVRPIPNDGQTDGYHQYHAVAPDEGQGDEYWYHLSVKFDINSPDGGWRIFWQWHGWDGYSPPLSLSYNFDDLQMSVFAGQLAGDSGAPWTSRSSNTLADGKGIAVNVPFGLNRPGQPGMRDQWHDILVHVNWTPVANAGGFVEVYHKYADQTAYTKVIDMHSTPQFPGGIPTMHSTSLDEYGNSSVKTLTNYMKFGYYRKSYCKQPTAPTAWNDPAACGSTQGTQPTDILWFDDFAQGTSQAAVDSGGTIAAPASTATQPASTGGDQPAVTGFTPVTCGSCNLTVDGSSLYADITGGRDDLDTAYGLKDFGGAAGWSSRTYVRDVARLDADQQLGANLSVLQERDVNNALIYELYLGADRTLRLWSPAGGLRADPINATTNVTIANDRTTYRRIEVSALKNDSIVVRVDGSDRINVTGLYGATTGNARYLRVGVDHYDTAGVADGVGVFHDSIGITTLGWLGARGITTTTTSSPTTTTATTTPTTTTTTTTVSQPPSTGGDQPSVTGFSNITCSGCSLTVNGSSLYADIKGGRDGLDTAYGLKDFGGTAGWSSRSYVRDSIRLGAGEQLGANLSVFQVRDVNNALIYELYLGPDRTLRLWSPAGGLRSAGINANSGVAIANDSTTFRRVEVSALRNDSIVVRIDGVDRITLTGLSGAATGNARYLRAGIDHYDTAGTTDGVGVFHNSIGITTTGWLGDRGATGTTATPTTTTTSGGTTTTASPTTTTTTTTTTATATTTPAPTPPPPGAGTNLAPNPSFESDPSSDYFFVTDGGTHSWATDAAHSGSHSLKIVSNSSSTSRWMSQTNRISAQAGVRYHASAWLKTSGIGATVVITFWGSSCPSGFCGVAATSPNTGGDWSKVSVDETAPAGTTAVRLELRLNGVGTMWADDVEVTPA